MKRGFLALGVLLVFCGALSFQLRQELSAGQALSVSPDVLYQIIGSAKEMIGDTLYTKADIYFHGGVYGQEDFLGSESLQDNTHDKDEKLSDNWIRKINRQIGVSDHRHLEGPDEEVEMLPFLTLATHLNPHHIEGLTTEAYWLAYRLGRVEEALGVLERGIRKNPDAWQLYDRLGVMYFRLKEDYAKSAEAFLKMIDVFDNGSDTSGPDKNAYRLAHYLLAESYMRLDDLSNALVYYKRTLDLFDPNETIPLKQKIERKIQDLVQQ